MPMDDQIATANVRQSCPSAGKISLQAISRRAEFQDGNWTQCLAAQDEGAKIGTIRLKVYPKECKTIIDAPIHAGYRV